MHQDHLDMESVTLELDEEELDRIDDIAFADHRDNREAAIRELLDEWLKAQKSEDSGGES
ncbi:ribbon-helix-helix protein, CopG family [Halorussus limi]|uniref:Ribbon-helix-helix protein, CopG family n=1 Tax=Halorussus limi TaxID=2938695 RepID=A0A8U0HUL4_9EURY|nr:ribbon-helix-helix protein, CopG family [Halorussus limi]UPV74710.1 ribbon-helix-helix protein, CopG family [Halorussus limi]